MEIEEKWTLRNATFHTKQKWVSKKKLFNQKITTGDNKARSEVPYITPYTSIVYHAFKAYRIRYDTYNSNFFFWGGGAYSFEVYDIFLCFWFNIQTYFYAHAIEVKCFYPTFYPHICYLFYASFIAIFSERERERDVQKRCTMCGHVR